MFKFTTGTRHTGHTGCVYTQRRVRTHVDLRRRNIYLFIIFTRNLLVIRITSVDRRIDLVYLGKKASFASFLRPNCLKSYIYMYISNSLYFLKNLIFLWNEWNSHTYSPRSHNVARTRVSEHYRTRESSLKSLIRSIWFNRIEISFLWHSRCKINRFKTFAGLICNALY